MKVTRHFINLTNGIEAIPNITEPYSFIRIQSTACEQKRWDFILQDIDYHFLLSLSLGYHCRIYDFGANKQVPRALYQGVEWIKYALNRRWLNTEIDVFVRGHKVNQYFSQQYEMIEEKTFKKLDYAKKFLDTTALHIEIVANATLHDGDLEYYRSILHEAA